MLQREEDIRDEAVRNAAREILLGIRTAPKTRGHDKLTILIATEKEQLALAEKMEAVAARDSRPTFARDAKAVHSASAAILVGALASPYGLNCGWCGYPTCAEKPAQAPCSFGSIDLGIGAGVASARLADKFIDNRMMFSMGYAAVELGWFPQGVVMAVGFPLSSTGKNPNFDR